ncbi:Long-chain-fatty-acid--CoA ligase 6 [Labeo rohita]|uniref:Long-chain-fatty-acid--CoA ligase 6 n=1 Tax=Labeo rohita TaxID=84645 RepID=A0ABQ8KYM7_LABRO|nr:Long-chain-fatty-acid--CoA ligase 6 [Labeo rohita]
MVLPPHIFLISFIPPPQFAHSVLQTMVYC